MHIAMWILQVLLGLLFVWAGGFKLVVPIETMTGAALLEHYVCVISPVEDESLSPDVVQVMSVSVRWPGRSGLHDAA